MGRAWVGGRWSVVLGGGGARHRRGRARPAPQIESHQMSAWRLARLWRPTAAIAAVGCASATAFSGLAHARSSEKIRINYFNIMGPIEPARLALVLGGIAFEDARHDYPAFQAKKEAGALPYGQLPTMEVDGQTIAQSVSAPAVSRPARSAGPLPAPLLHPALPMEQARVTPPCSPVHPAPRRRAPSPTTAPASPASFPRTRCNKQRCAF